MNPQNKDADPGVRNQRLCWKPIWFGGDGLCKDTLTLGSIYLQWKEDLPAADIGNFGSEIKEQ